jgi:hypothetical protein
MSNVKRITCPLLVGALAKFSAPTTKTPGCFEARTITRLLASARRRAEWMELRSVSPRLIDVALNVRHLRIVTATFMKGMGNRSAY